MSQGKKVTIKSGDNSDLEIAPDENFDIKVEDAEEDSIVFEEDEPTSVPTQHHECDGNNRVSLREASDDTHTEQTGDETRQPHHQ